VNIVISFVLLLIFAAFAVIWNSPDLLDDLGRRYQARAAALAASREAYQKTFAELYKPMEAKHQ
jgi:hypothetical protein